MRKRRPSSFSLSLLSALALLPRVQSQIFTAATRSCLGTGSLIAPADQQLNLTQLYAQLDQGQTYPGELAHGFDYSTRPQLREGDGNVLTGTGDVLRVVLTGTTVEESQGYSNDTAFLSTLVVSSEILTFPIDNNQSALCSSIRTALGATGTTTNGTATVTESGCPYSGDIALGFSIPLRDSYALTTITAQLVVLDPSDPALHLACYDLEFTPYYPAYFVYPLIHYIPIGLLAAYLLLYVLARGWASYTNWLHDNETHLASSLTLKLSSTDATLSRRKMWGAIWFSAWAGKQVVGSGSLRRFVTAEFRELFAMGMWCGLVGTAAVNWPGFAYPVFAQTAWTSLIYNNTLSFTSLAPSHLSDNFTAPPLFASQMHDITSPLYLDTSLPNVLLDLESSAPGIERWARAIGVRAEDLWSICAFTFFAICAAVIVAHALFAAVDAALDALFPSRFSKARLRAESKAEDLVEPSFPASKEERSSTGSFGGSRRLSDGSMRRFMDEGESGDDAYMRDDEGYGSPRPEDNFPSWQLHLALLQGNLTRVLLLFHLPLSLFTVYELSNYSHTPTSTFALAVVTLAVVCVGAPVYLLWRVHQKNVRELYSSLPTLLSLGVLYNSFSDECTMFAAVKFGGNLVLASALGAVQKTGTAQAAVILLVEVGDTLVTSLWLPWGDNSAMGPLAFLLSLSRIIIAVLLVVLSPAVDVAPSASSWIAYIVFLVQGLVLLLLMLVLAFKIFEFIIRLVGDVPFDESRSPRAGGLSGALRKCDRGGRGKSRRGRASGGKGGGRGGTAGAGRRRDLEDLRRTQRQVGSESTVGTHTRLLGAGHRGQQSQASSLSYADTGGTSSYPRYQPNQGEDEGGFIMSAMSSGPWTSSSPGYVKPGAYSTGGPVLRSGPTWGDQVTVVPAASTGFARVGGGRATYSNPYQLANSPSTAYQSYPSPSANLYGAATPSSSHATGSGNPRRLSQSAVIEMASADPLTNATRHATRPSLAQPPSSSALLSNTVSHYSSPTISPAASSSKKAQTGFFGRFRKPKRANSDDASDDSDDDSDDDDERPAKGAKKWGLRFGGGGGKRKSEEVKPEPEPDEGGGETGFVVTRKPRPRPSRTSSAPGSAGVRKEESGGIAMASSAPHVSVEGPSPPASINGKE